MSSTTTVQFARTGRVQSFSGKEVRLRRIFGSQSGNTLILAMDHAVASGLPAGLRDADAVVGMAASGGADAVLMRPGLISSLSADSSGQLGVILKLTGRLSRGLDHVVFNTVEHAVACGADAVCAEFKLGSPGDLENVRLVARVAEAARKFNMPLLVTTYVVDETLDKFGPSAHAHACRIAEEIGADFIKTSLPDDREVVEQCVGSVSIPVILAGGPSRDVQDLAQVIRRGTTWGLAGAAIGRAAWSAPNPAGAVHTLAEAVHGKPLRPSD